MSDERITELDPLAGTATAASDEILVVDVDDTSMAPTGTTKNQTIAQHAIALATVNGLVAIDKIFDAKGDLPVGTAADTAAKLTVGANGTVLTAASGQTTGLQWATPKTVATDTLWDAKGDLAVGTGADTSAKLTVGANDYVLTADSAQTTGLKWAAAAGGSGPASPSPTDGAGTLIMHTWPGWVAQQISTMTLSANRVNYVPMVVLNTITIDRLGAEITTASAAGKFFKVNIFTADADWQPVSAVSGADTGNIAADPGAVPNMSLATVSATLTAGLYIAAIWSDGGPVCRTVRGTPITGPMFNPAASGNVYVEQIYVASTYGAWAATKWTNVANGSSNFMENPIRLRIAT